MIVADWLFALADSLTMWWRLRRAKRHLRKRLENDIGE